MDIKEKLLKELQSNSFKMSKRKDGRLCCRIPKPPELQSEGKSENRYQYIYAKNKFDLSQKRRKAIIDILSKLDKVDGELFEVALQNWLSKNVYGKIRPTSYDRKECTLNHQIIPVIKEKFEKIKTTDVTEETINYILQYNLEKGYSYSTLKKTHMFLSEFFDWWCERTAISTNPVKKCSKETMF